MAADQALLFPPERLVISITGPSGAGKSAIIDALRAQDPHIQLFVSATTRPPRLGEVHGEHYFFIDRETFDAKLAAGEFLEHNAAYHGNKYGTLTAHVQGLLQQGFDVISDINWIGVAQFEQKIPENLIKIAIMPPNVEALAARFAHRAKTSKEDEAVRQIRMEQVRVDMRHQTEPDYVFTNPDMVGSKLTDYDLVIVNDRLEAAVAEVHDFIQKQRQKRKKSG